MGQGGPAQYEQQSNLDTFAVLRMAMDVLSSKVYRWATAAGSFALFAWACAHPESLRFLAAFTFCAMVHIPTWAMRR